MAKNLEVWTLHNNKKNSPPPLVGVVKHQYQIQFYMSFLIREVMKRMQHTFTSKPYILVKYTNKHTLIHVGA